MQDTLRELVVALERSRSKSLLYFVLEGALRPPPTHPLAGIDPTFRSLRLLVLHITD